MANDSYTRATGIAFPVRKNSATAAQGVVIDIIERRHPSEEEPGNAYGVVVPTHVIINGQEVLIPADARIEVQACGNDANRVTLTMFARRVRLGLEEELAEDGAPAGGLTEGIEVK